MKIIGIHGKARSGKDEIAKVLEMGYGFKRVAFADKLKEFGIAYFGLDFDDAFKTKTANSRAILQGIGLCVRNEITNVKDKFRSSEFNEKGITGYPKFVEELGIKYFRIQSEDLARKLKYNKAVLSGLLAMWTDKLDEFVEITEGKDKFIWVNYLYQQLNKHDTFVVPDLRFQNEKKFIKEIGGKVIKIIRLDNPQIEAGEKHESEVDLDNETDWDHTIINEHVSDWYQKLEYSIANMMRGIIAKNDFFDEKDTAKFKVKL